MGDSDFNGFLDLPGKKLAVQVEGPASARALLFMHGLGNSLAFWGAVAADLPDFRIIRYDFDGAGISPLSTPDLSIDSLAADALAVLDKLGVKKATIIGHSMSGLVASTIAAQHPERVEKLILVGAITAPNEAGVKGMQGRIEKTRSEGMFGLADAVPTAAFSKYSKANRKLAYAFVRHIVGSQKPENYAAACHAIIKSRDPDYSSIRAPTLVLAGKEDAMSPATTNERFQSEIPNCKVVVIEDCGHWHAVEDPERTAKEIKAFVAG